MKKIASFLAAWLVSASAFGQVNCNEGLEPLDPKAESRMTAMDFIHDVAANEVVFARAFTRFSYTLDVSLQTLQGDAVDGEYHQVSKISYDEAGVRRPTVLQETNTLKRVILPDRDVDALRDSFTITPAILGDRDIVYSGRQRVADFNAAAFDILPRNNQSNERTFRGRVWVRVRDNAISRICGRVTGGPFGPMRYLVERTKVADQYWFPTVIRADENVRAADKDVRVRIAVKFSDYTAR